MFRVKIIDFIKRNKYKFYEIGKKLVIVAIVVLIATIILSISNNVEDYEEEEQNKEVFKPTDTIIEGSDISEEEYEKASNIVEDFLSFCNNGNIQAAYNLLTDECKADAYPNIELFKQNYCNIIFNKKRECNIQAWISTKEYTVYKVRYTNNLLQTGIYDEEDIYQDYITLNKKNNTEKLSIGDFIDSEETNIITQTDELDVTVLKKKIFMTYEEYEMNVRNKTDKTILLDNLEKNKNIKLVADGGAEYFVNTNKLFLKDLIIQPNEEKTITIRANKNFSSGNSSREINMYNIIKDYNLYVQNEEEYIDITTITINVED